ncbi:MAG: signal peptidase II [Proteobacteria bacterium]|nr:signal peptidase II [Pseudomonadota bacterium]MDA1355534.1 signal peptidase II [Pseudomonadota bacterium]
MIRLGLPVTVLALLLDQITKLVAHDSLWQPPRRVELLGFLDLVPVENRGISFGLFRGEGNTGVWLISAFALIICLCLGLWMSRVSRRWPAVALGLIIGGALGNVIDRLRLGWVIDFIDFHVSTWHWPAFNMADAAITVGVAIMLIDGLFGTAKKPK